MKKILIIIFCFVAFTAFAQVRPVIVTGSGATEAEARNSAFVAAIEQAIGVMVSSDVLVKNGELIEERIKTRSDGFIKTYATLSSGRAGDVCSVTIRAEVAQEALTKELEIITGTKIDIDGASIAASVATKQKLYEDLVADFPARAAELVQMLLASCGLIITGMEFDHEANSSKVPFTVTIEYHIDQADFDSAMAELDKTFMALGAERSTFYDNENQKNILKVRNDKTPPYQYVFTDNTYRLIEKYFLETLDDYSKKIKLSISSADKVLFTNTDGIEADVILTPSYTHVGFGRSIEYALIRPTISLKSGYNRSEINYEMTGTIKRDDIERITAIEVSFPID